MVGKRISLLFLFCGMALFVFGQKKKKSQSTSVETVLPQNDYSPKKKLKGAETTFNARDNFYDHKEELDKQRVKNLRNSMKPQYADKEYFGHKHLPKKRKAGKMKFCKVCGIRH